MTSSSKQILLFGLTLISLTACSKKFTQSDLDNARREGEVSAQPSDNRRALLEAQKKLALKAREVSYTADTMQRTLLLEGVNASNGNGFYSKAGGIAEVKKWGDATKALITAAFGKSTNTDGAELVFLKAKGKSANKIVIGLDKAKNIDKSVIYTVGGYDFIFAKAANPALVFSIENNKRPKTTTNGNSSGQMQKDSVIAVKLTLRKSIKGTALSDETTIADNLSGTSTILAALQDALAQAIDATRK